MIGLLYNGPIKSNIHLKGTGMNTDNIFDNVSPKTTNHTVSIEFALAEREVWTRAACAVASANDCKSTTTAINWANKITDAYVERFGKSDNDRKGV